MSNKNIPSVVLFLFLLVPATSAGSWSDDEAGGAVSPPPASHPGLLELLGKFDALFEKAMLEKDTAAKVALIRDNKDLVVLSIRKNLDDYLLECCSQKKVLDRKENANLAKALAITEIYVKLYRKPVLENVVRKTAEWDLEQIGMKAYGETVRQDGEIYFDQQHPSKSLQMFQTCEKVFQTLGDSFGLMNTYLNMGAAEKRLGRTESAVCNIKKALELTEELDDMRVKALCLFNAGILHFEKNEYEEALDAMDQAMDISKRLGLHEEVASIDSSRTAILHELGKTGEAEAKLREMAADFEASGNKAAACDTYRNLALFIMDEGDSLEEARAFCRKSLKISREIHRPGDEAAALILLGIISSRLGQLNEAMANLDGAYEINSDLGNASGMAEALCGMSEAHLSKGWLIEGRKKAEEALDLLKDGGGTYLCRLSLRKDMYTYAMAAGDRDGAAKWLLEAVEIARSSGSPPVIAQIYCTLSNHYLDETHFDEALSYALKAVELVDDPDLAKSRAIAFRAVGYVYSRLNRLDKACAYFRKSVDCFSGNSYSPIYLGVCNDLAGCLCALGKNSEAVELYGTVMKMAQERQAMPTQAQVLVSLGALLFRQQRYNDSYRCLDAARRIFMSMASTPNVRKVNLKMAEILIVQDHHDLARNIIEEKESIPDKLDPAAYSYYMGLRGLILYSEGEIRKALDCFLESLDSQDLIIRHTRSLSEFSRGAYAESWTWIYLHAIRCCEQLFDATGDPSFLKQAFRVEERAKARIFLDSLARTGLDVEPVVSNELRLRYEEVRSRLSSIQDMIDREQAGNAAGREKRLEALERDFKITLDVLEDVLKDMRNEHPAFAYLRYPEPLAIEGFQELLDPSDVYISFILSNKDGIVLAVTRDECRVRSLADPISIMEKVQAWRSMIKEPKVGDDTFLELARELYISLLSPVEDLIQDKKRLIVSNDGVLNSLPLETLLYADLPENGSTPSDRVPYLLKKYSITYVPSASAYQFLRSQTASKKLYPASPDRKEFCAFGGVSGFDPGKEAVPGEIDDEIASLDATRGIMGTLPYSTLEVEGISVYFDSERFVLYIGDSANESTLRKREIQSSRIIHFATHATVNEDAPLSSSIILSPSEGEDGYWRVFEIYRSQIRAELVVLSACSTNIGKTVVGEGVFGLVRAFLYAGADSVVATNWEVRDCFSSLLMKRFYKYMIKDGLPRAEALRLAKLDAISGKLDGLSLSPDEKVRDIARRSPGSGKIPYSHPYFWAPFILFGLPE